MSTVKRVLAGSHFGEQQGSQGLFQSPQETKIHIDSHRKTSLIPASRSSSALFQPGGTAEGELGLPPVAVNGTATGSSIVGCRPHEDSQRKFGTLSCARCTSS